MPTLVTRLVECHEPLLSSSSLSEPPLQLIKDWETHTEQRILSALPSLHGR